jgi:hypothetical protein
MHLTMMPDRAATPPSGVHSRGYYWTLFWRCPTEVLALSD